MRVHVYGASGYAAAELIALLARHPRAGLGALESASHAGEPIARQFPELRFLGRCFDPPGSVEAQFVIGDVVVLAGSHGVAKTVAPALLKRGARVIDLSGDYRLAPSLAVYGFAERYRDQIAAAQFVANPGCYPTATLLATLPLAAFAPQRIIVDAKSGITGAGRTPAAASLFAEVEGDVRAYGLTGHRHEPEILQEWRAAGIHADLIFTPQVVPVSRGMLVNAYAIFAHPLADDDEVHTAFERAYGGNPFVRILTDGMVPSMRAVRGTNDAELHVSVSGNVVRVLCAIDNLGRGAASQAVANLNIMHGYPAEEGIDARIAV
ncbi:MAG TPA: N-acetyl-gamma-glutamyl-phosphate reductase [Candidatus Baltobacteraceae bacterium]|nr:N-acetyl-gamma-glutamyl-phosphate reductase [Candidatus Baltobacteraceae bacterium]